MKSISQFFLAAALALGSAASFAEPVVYVAVGLTDGSFACGDAPDPRTCLIRGFQFHHDNRKDIGTGGVPTGANRFAPVTFVKPLEDGLAPFFEQAVASSEELDFVFFQFYRSPTDEFPYYTIELDGAYVVDARSWAPDSEAGGEARQSVSFSFQTITWRSFDGSGTIVDERTATWSPLP